MGPAQLKSSRSESRRIGDRLRQLRVARRWSQLELAQQLGISQPYLSKVERGHGSLTAENFLRALQLFNVGVEEFGVTLEGGSAIQNALARHGAKHLVENEALTPTSFDEPIEVVFEVLRNPESARHVTALAPVLIARVDAIALPELATRLVRIGREARLGWLLENVHAAIAQAGATHRHVDQRNARRADLAASLLLRSGTLKPPSTTAPLDLLDSDIRTEKTAERVFEDASPAAKRWRIATRIQPSDFADALKAAHESR